MFRAALLFCLVLAFPARAELLVCNETDAKVSFALGYKANGAWTSEGWWNIPPYDCSVVEGGDLSNRYYYYRVTSKTYSWPGEKYFFCTSPDVFTIDGDEDCQARGYDRSEFRQIDTGNAASFTLNLTAAAATAPPAPKPAPAQAAPPGTYGEPYTIAGVLSHCDVFDSTMQCEIHADGWRYVANSADPTPLPLLEELMTFEPNTPVEISGDMISYEGLTADITIRDYNPGFPDPFATERYSVQGLWRSLDDPSYEVLIYGGIMEEMTNGTPDETSLITWSDTCEGALGAGPAMMLKPFDDPEFERCMILVQATSQLVLFPVGSMRDLMFQKVN